MTTVYDKIEEWAIERNLIDGSTSQAQFVKLAEELGEVCEAYIDYPPQWVETEIVAHKDGFAIGWCKSVMKGCHGDKAHEFRPLRTERDKAIDEMQRIIEESNKYGVREQLGVLYDAGMYKEVK